MKWENKIVEIEDKPSHRINRMTESWLNTMGKEGWELVAITEKTFYFKRPCEQPTQEEFEMGMRRHFTAIGKPLKDD